MSIPKEPEQVMKMRGGSVLGKKTILKSDHFPGCQNKRLSPQIDGAPNYRQVIFVFYFPFPFSSTPSTAPSLGHIFVPRLYDSFLSFPFLYSVIKIVSVINLGDSLTYPNCRSYGFSH